MSRIKLFGEQQYFSSILGSGLLAYSVLFPFWLIVNAWLPLTGLRVYLSWMVLLAGLMSIASLVFWSKSLFESMKGWIVENGLLLSVLVLWLVLMGLSHGVTGKNQEGLISGFLAIGLGVPFCFVVSLAWVGKRIWIVVIAITLVLLFENAWLCQYLLRGVSMSSRPEYDFEFNPLPGLKRIFVNVRDGNTFSILLIGLVQCLGLRCWPSCRIARFSLESSRSGGKQIQQTLLLVFAISAAFLNAFLTQGRGVFLSALLGLICLFISFISRNRYFPVSGRLWGVVWVSLLGFLLAFLFYTGILFLFGKDASLFSSMIDRSARDLDFSAAYGRVFIWRSYIVNWLHSGFWFGSGFGFKPEEVVFLGVTGAHNVLIQLLSGSGIMSAFPIVACGMAVFKCCRICSFDTLDRFALMAGGLGTYSMLHSLLFWPSGVFALTLIPVIVFPGCGCGGVGVATCRSVWVGIRPAFLSLLWLAVVMVFAFRFMSCR